MLFGEENEHASKCDVSLSMLLAACEVLAPVLTQAAVSAPVLLECLYYANEEDLLRLIAALGQNFFLLPSSFVLIFTLLADPSYPRALFAVELAAASNASAQHSDSGADPTDPRAGG